MTTHQSQDDLLLYALNELSPEAAERVRRHVAGCDECRIEMENACAALGLLGLTTETAAPPELRDRILGQARRLQAPSHDRAARRGPWFWVPALASMAFAASAAWLWHTDSTLRRQLKDLQARDQNVAAQAQFIGQVLNAPDAQQFSLLPVNASPVPQGKAIYRPQHGTLIFIGWNFASVPAGKAYELWLLPVSGGSPIPAGVFRPDAAGNVSVVAPKLSAGGRAKGFAITLEAESGSQTPTPPILLAGTHPTA